MDRFVSLISCVALPLLFVGCGSQLPTASGVVTLDGQPLDHGRVTYQADGQAMAFGEIASDGTYHMMTGTQPGVAAGSYRATVTAYQVKQSDDDLGEPIPVLLTPKKYNSLDDSGLTAEVEAGHNDIDFTLTSE